MSSKKDRPCFEEQIATLVEAAGQHDEELHEIRRQLTDDDSDVVTPAKTTIAGRLDSIERSIDTLGMWVKRAMGGGKKKPGAKRN